jgi:hypothetical protein
MKTTTKKKATLDTIATSIDDLDKTVDTKINVLAQAFDVFTETVDTKMNVLAKTIDLKIDGLAQAVTKGFADQAVRMDSMETRILNLELGQENILLRLDNVAYKFEVVDLHRRVDILERRARRK